MSTLVGSDPGPLVAVGMNRRRDELLLPWQCLLVAEASGMTLKCVLSETGMETGHTAEDSVDCRKDGCG